MKDKIFRETMVVSRDIITDWVQGIRNILGLRLKAYENRINSACEELKLKWLIKETKWFRYDIETGGNGEFIISIYGEYK